MTNLEWLHSLSVEELGNAILRGRCNLCVYQQSEECPTDKNGCYDCKGGFKEWCNAEHAPTYRVNWCIHRGGHFDIKANSEEEAIQIVRKEKLSEILNDIKNDISLSIDKTGE